MTALVSFVKFWRYYYRQPGDPISREEAYQNHQNGNQYTLLIGKHSSPRAFIKISAPEHYGVCVLDKKFRPDLIYDFHKIESGKLFLSCAKTWEYFDDVETMDTICHFDRSGEVTVIRSTYLPDNEKIEESAVFEFDLPRHFAEKPEFGEVGDLLEFGKRDLGDTIFFNPKS